MMLMTLEGYDGPDRILLSYDVSGSSRSKAVQVCRIVFGRTRTNGDDQARQEEGFIHRPGVVWVGQSVLILPSADAEELAARLRDLGVRVALGPVTIARATLERFRRPARDPGLTC